MAKSSLLWRLESSHYSGYSYLFGTMHVSDDRVFSRIEDVKNTLSDLSDVYLESDLSLMQESFVQDVFVLKKGNHLSDFVKPHLFEKYRSVLKKSLDLDLKSVDGLHPVAVHNMLVSKVLNSEKSESLDQHIWNMAKDLNLKTGGLETVEEQMTVMKTLELGSQYKSLIEIAKNPRKFKHRVKNLLALYLDEDIHQLYISSKKGVGSASKLFLKERNFRMASRMNDIMKNNNNCLFAVGAGHLSGKFGLLSLLRSRDYKLKALR